MSGRNVAMDAVGKPMEELVSALPAGFETSVQAKVSGSGGAFGSVLAEAFRMASRFAGTLRPEIAEAFGGNVVGPVATPSVAVAVVVTVGSDSEVIATFTVPPCVPVGVTVRFSCARLWP